ncbi:MAG: hypothetical protein ACI9AQ_000447 [Dinoroseobacter sp.]|jgi:hypothetical protein
MFAFTPKDEARCALSDAKIGGGHYDMKPKYLNQKVANDRIRSRICVS